MNDLDELRRIARDLMLDLVRIVARRRKIVERIAEEKGRAGLPLENHRVEAELWSAVSDEADELGLDERTIGAILWSLIRDSLKVQGVEEPGDRLAELERWIIGGSDMMRLDADYWEPLVEPNVTDAHDLAEAEGELAASLRQIYGEEIDDGGLVTFPSWREAVRSVLQIFGEGKRVMLHEPVHPWLTAMVWSTGGRPVRIRREPERCWRIEEPEDLGRGSVMLVELPDYNTGTVHGHGELDELEGYADRNGIMLVSLEACRDLVWNGRQPSLAGRAMVVGGIGCALGSLDRGPAWILTDGRDVSALRNLRASYGLVPHPRDVSAAAFLMNGGLDDVRMRVKRRVEEVEEVLDGWVSYCKPDAGPHMFIWSNYLNMTNMLKTGVVVAPGEAFGGYPHSARVNLLVREEEFLLGLGRIILSLSPR